MLDWVGKYDISVESLIRQGVACSERQRKLFFIWRSPEGTVQGWQSRNFQEGSVKYTSSGNLEQQPLPIYRRGNEPISGRIQIVLTEDCLSAIKIAEQLDCPSTKCNADGQRLLKPLEAPTFDAMPCLTSSLSTSKLKRLAGLYGAFLVWLDSDMFHNAQEMVRKLQIMGCEARAIWTPLDPKCYKSEEICNTLLTGRSSGV